MNVIFIFLIIIMIACLFTKYEYFDKTFGFGMFEIPIFTITIEDDR
jgi:hypothetical protein